MADSDSSLHSTASFRCIACTAHSATWPPAHLALAVVPTRQVTALVRASSDTGGVLQHPSVRLVVGDVCDPGSIQQQWFEGVDYVVSVLGLRCGGRPGCMQDPAGGTVTRPGCPLGPPALQPCVHCRRSMAVTDAELWQVLHEGTLAVFRQACSEHAESASRSPTLLATLKRRHTHKCAQQQPMHMLFMDCNRPPCWPCLLA